MDRALGTRPYFTGDGFGWGDVCVVPFVQAAAMTGAPPASGSALSAWLDRVLPRPSVATTFEAAAQSFGGFEMLPQLVESGHFRREYRDHRLRGVLPSGGGELGFAGLRERKT